MAAPTATLHVAIKDLATQEYLGLRFTSRLDAVGRDVQDAFRRLYERIAEAESDPCGPPFLIASQPSGGMLDVEAGAPCAPVPEPSEGLHAGRLVGGRAATLVHRGPYEEIGPLYPRLFAWIAEQGFTPAGPPREVYLNGPDEVSSPADLETELVVPIA